MTVDEDADIRRKETASWFARLNQRKVAAADIKAFSAWRRIPENAEAYDRMQAVWDATETLADDPEIAALTKHARDAASASARARALFSDVLKPLGAAGAMVAVLVVGFAVWGLSRPTPYATAIGEQRTVRLGDGSRITLDTASKVEVRLGRHRRSVVLVEGRALFDVEGDTDRPFVVTAGDTRVTAVGTRFDVRRVGSGARVVLVEGRVAVRDGKGPDHAWSLAPGQQVLTTAPRPAIAAIDVPTVTSWASGRLTFRETPIGEAVAEVNRYSPRRIELRAADFAAIPVSGVFDTGDVDGFVAALTDLYPLRATRSADGTIVLSDDASK